MPAPYVVAAAAPVQADTVALVQLAIELVAVAGLYGVGMATPAAGLGVEIDVQELGRHRLPVANIPSGVQYLAERAQPPEVAARAEADGKQGADQQRAQPAPPSHPCLAACAHSHASSITG